MESHSETLAMFNVQLDNRVPGFRVGLLDEEGGTQPSAVALAASPATLGNDSAAAATRTASLPSIVDLIGMSPYLNSRLDQPTWGADPGRGRPYPQNFFSPEGPSSSATTLFDRPLALGQPSSVPIGVVPSKGALWPGPQAGNGGFTLARYDAGGSPRPSDLTGTSPADAQVPQGADEVQSAQSAQGPAPGPRTPTDISPGVAVVLPDGSTIPHPESPTGKLMSPVADLSQVAAAGQRTGEALRAMLDNPEAAPAALPYLVAALHSNVSQRGTFDYQRKGDQFFHQFMPVSNVNVGIFAQQAGLTLEETLTIAGLYARLFSSNAEPDRPYGLNPQQLRFITLGHKIGQSGVFNPPLPP
jgi:hypothetical protein